MANNKLYITISDKRLGDGGNTPSSSNSSEREANSMSKEDNLIKRYAEHELFHLVKATTTRAINYSISNIGNFTGDYITQRKVNVAKGIVDSAVTIGVSTIAGAKYGPIGAAIGFVTGVASETIMGVLDDISNRAENTKANFNIEQLREKVGLNTKLDGSRGTEN